MVYRNKLTDWIPLVFVLLLLIIWPVFANRALTGLLTKILIFALLAASLDFIMGFGGLWSFCQGALFGVGAYTVAILAKRCDITLSFISVPIAVLLTVLTACIFGFIALRVSTIYFLVITFALGQLVYSVALKWTPLTGGSNGMGGVPFPDLGFRISWTPAMFYYFVLIICIICFLLLFRIVKSHFGLSMQGIKENETRMKMLGYNTWAIKFFAFCIGGFFAGISGVLYVYYNGAITPSQVGVTVSGLMWFIIIIGGSGTLWGAVIGSFIVSLLQYYTSIIIPERWPIVFGSAFVLSVMFLRGGIFPHLHKLWVKVNGNLDR